MSTFSYRSHQLHLRSINGQTKQQENSITIKNGKGVKTVSLTANGKTRKVSRTLTEKNIQCIQKHQFIPGLFNDCLQAVNVRLSQSLKRRSSKKKGKAKK